MRELMPFQTTIETLRAHHWAYWADVYSGCHFDCAYCLYRGTGTYARVEAKEDVVAGIIDDIRGMPREDRGVLCLGSRTDCYQALEAEKAFLPRVLSACLEMSQPLFICTKGTNLVLRDLPLFKAMAEKGLIEISMTVITLNEDYARRLEPGADLPCRRIETAARLSTEGVPVSFHFAPYVPGMDSSTQLEQLIGEMARAGGRHVFSCTLGGRRAYWDNLVKVMNVEEFARPATLANGYPVTAALSDRRHAQGVDVKDLVCAMTVLRNACTKHRIGFVCENIPLFSSSPQRDGIYRWSRPTVYDMMKYVERAGRPVSFADLSAEFFAKRPASTSHHLIRRLWDEKELFQMTDVQPVCVDGQLAYQHEPGSFAKLLQLGDRGLRSRVMTVAGA